MDTFEIFHAKSRRTFSPCKSLTCRDPAGEKQRRKYLMDYCRWQFYVIRGMYTTMHIIVETCIEQISAGADPKFYRKCERNGEFIARGITEMMKSWWHDEFSDNLPELYMLRQSYKPWVQSFLDKMMSLDTESSLMAIMRIKHAQEHYGKSVCEFQEWTESLYIDADPTRASKIIYLDPSRATIVSEFMTVRNMLENLPPPTPSKGRSRSRTNSSDRSFINVIGRGQSSRRAPKLI